MMGRHDNGAMSTDNNNRKTLMTVAVAMATMTMGKRDDNSDCRPCCIYDYPDTNFWKREAWSKHKKELKDLLQLGGLGHQSSPQGGMKVANMENMMMQYLEEADGTMVSGAIIANIQNQAQTIWIHLHKRDLAPATWGDVLIVVQDKYYNDIERKFKVLQYCENHWKAQAVATAISSQWHSSYQNKQSKWTIKEEPANTNKPLTNVGLFNTQNTTPFAVLGVVPEDIMAPTLNIDECDSHINGKSCDTGKPDGTSPPSPQHLTPPGPVSPPLDPNNLVTPVQPLSPTLTSATLPDELVRLPPDQAVPNNSGAQILSANLGMKKGRRSYTLSQSRDMPHKHFRIQMCDLLITASKPILLAFAGI
ncbi:hypothetical protein EDB83DRAFT_2319525 [Lactarius deliciosus]|nr:hypothetical protein EDB83DRAFT_2319525 [Lactarius deliciosus]